MTRPISYTPDGRPALRGVSLCVGPGEIACIVGANGSGKSLLLKILAGSIGPDEGEIDSFGGGTPCLVTAEAFDAFTEATGADWLSANEGDRFGVPADRPIGGISSGERQRLALSTAAISSAGVVLLDSPSAHL
ncbi:MAG: ATP-binding cassette domain-containing protein, partial [Acidimicrobiales bacterium]